MFLLLFSFASLIGVSALQNSTPGQIISRLDIWSRKDGDLAYEGYYQDKVRDQPSVQVQIPSDIIRDDVLRVFIPAHISDQDSLEKFIQYDSISNIEDEEFNKGQYLLNGISNFYRLTIDDSTFRSKMYFHRIASSKQKGYLTYLNISHLEEGLYELTVEGPEEMFEDDAVIVPFYKLD